MGASTVSYRQALRNAAPTIAVLLVVCAVGYLYARTWWWLVIFFFGALAAFVDQLYYQKTLRLRDRLRDR